jgi:hypothetical protein
VAVTETLFDLERFKEWARTEITEDDGLNAQAGAAAVASVGAWAGRTFTWIDTATATATVRRFRPWGSGTRILPIDDAAEITAVTESGSALTVDVGYQAEPFGNRNDAGDWRPYDRLVRLDQCWYTDDVRPTVTVTAKWGWTTIPAGAVEAVKVLAQDWAQNRNTSFGFGGVTPDGFSVGMRDNPLVVQAIHVVRGAKASPFGG